MAARNHRREIEKAFDRAKVRYAFRFPASKSGTLVVDLDPAAANLALARSTLSALPAPWPKFAAWLAAPQRAAEHRDGAILVTTAFAAPAAGSQATDEAALLAAIVDAPDDDAPRLVYADLLASRGDPRGELIVAQCRLARRDGNADDLERLDTRVAAMLSSGWKAYAGELAPYTNASSFQRGFVHEVRMTLAAFAKHGERVFGTWPTHTLDIANDRFTTNDLEKLAANPTLARVRGLSLGRRLDGPRPALAALATPSLPRLERLELAGCGTTDADWTKLFARLATPALAAIVLRANCTSAAIPAAIAANPALRTVRRFEDRVRECLDKETAHTAEGYARLAAAVELHHLVVEDTRLVDDKAIAAFFAPGAAAQLRSLQLEHTAASDHLLRVMAQASKLASLEEVELVGPFTPAGIAELLASRHATRLRRAALNCYEWTDEEIAEVVRILRALPERHPLRVVELPGHRSEYQALAARYEIR